VAVLVWFTMGVALWHFTVFVPDRFWGGIVGAFLGAVAGALLSGFLYYSAAGDTLGDTDIVTLLAAVPGTFVGLAIVYAIGARNEAHTT
jgi:hypothetical protein